MKTHITFEVDTNELFDTLKKMNGNTAPIGERIVGVMLADDGFFNKVGMAVYGVTVVERKPADAAPASAGDRQFCDFPKCDCSSGAAERCEHPPRPASAAEPTVWKKVPAEATQELLADASSKQAGDKQVLCYQGGAYYNAWLVFDEYEGGWIWMNEADSEPTPSHYTALPNPPLTTGP